MWTPPLHSTIKSAPQDQCAGNLSRPRTSSNICCILCLEAEIALQQEAQGLAGRKPRRDSPSTYGDEEPLVGGPEKRQRAHTCDAHSTSDKTPTAGREEVHLSRARAPGVQRSRWGPATTPGPCVPTGGPWLADSTDLFLSWLGLHHCVRTTGMSVDMVPGPPDQGQSVLRGQSYLRRRNTGSKVSVAQGWSVEHRREDSSLSHLTFHQHRASFLGPQL